MLSTAAPFVGQLTSMPVSGAWTPLGGNLVPGDIQYVGDPTLAASPRANPVLAFEAPDGVIVLRWNGSDWIGVGQPIVGTSGPSIGLDEDRRIYQCYSGKYAGTGAPNVKRWTGTFWQAIGGDISAEAGYRGTRYDVDACGGIALDRDNVPTVTWTAMVGVKNWAVFAAQWNRELRHWVGLGPDSLAVGQDVGTYVDIDRKGRPHLVTYRTTGGGSHRVTVTQVWCWNGSAWEQLGVDMLGIEDPIIGIDENAVYLFAHTEDGTLKVMRWHANAWTELPSPGTVTGRSAMDFTPSGRLVVAYVEPIDDGLQLNARVKVLARDQWENVGDIPVQVACGASECYPNASLDLSLDERGRPVLARMDQSEQLSGDGTTVPVTRVLVKRYSEALE
jgi:hypothetical protein